MFIYGKIFKKIPKIAVKSYKILSCVCVCGHVYER